MGCFTPLTWRHPRAASPARDDGGAAAATGNGGCAASVTGGFTHGDDLQPCCRGRRDSLARLARKPWLQVEINPDGDNLRGSLQSSAGLRPGARRIEGVTRAGLAALAASVERSARRREPLDAATRDALTALTAGLFTPGVLTDALLTKTLDAASERVLLRVSASEPDLQAFPWEALRTQDGPLAGSDRLGVVRLPRVGEAANQFDVEVEGALTVLTVAPAQETEAACEAVRRAMRAAEERGDVAWLAPVIRAGTAVELHRKLKEKAVQKPHVLHFIGHGDSRPGQSPRLEIADGVWLEIDAFARQVQQDFREVRLVVLEACRGAAPGAFASAAEHLCRAGVEAVVAFLWAVEEEVSEAFLAAFYGALTADGPSKGDVVAAMESARAALLGDSAAVFTPVLYLRGDDGRTFDFRKARTPARVVRPSELDEALVHLLSRPFSLVLGAAGGQEEILHLLREEVAQALRDDGATSIDGAPWSALADRYVWSFGAESLHQLCQQVLQRAAQSALEQTGDQGRDPVSRLARALGERLPAGVHVTLLWQPTLERIAGKQAGTHNMYAVQPSIRSMKDPPSVFRRDASRGRWTLGKPPEHIGPEDVCVLRLLGGVMPTDTFSSPVLTDDDHLVGVLASPTFRPAWVNPYLASLCGRPVLFVGLSAVDWHHRLLLRWLFDRSLPDESVVILPPGERESERIAWERGAGLGGQGRVYVVQRPEGEIADLLEKEASA